MIPSTFDYKAPASVEEAVAALQQAPFGSKILAGGQSFLPVLKLRMADPELVVSLNKVPEITQVTMEADTLVVGAMTTHAEVATHPLITEHAALLAKAAAVVADPQVRRRGTIGGAAVHADPAGDIGPALLALDAVFVIAGPDGTREVAAKDFFIDVFTTDVEDDEVLTQLRIPSHQGWVSHYEKFNRVAQQWSIVASGVALKLDGSTITEAKVALANMGPTPLRAQTVENSLTGAEATRPTIETAARSAAEGTDPETDLNGDAEYRKHLATVLTQRALLAATGIE